jgi:glycosyltransferase involved in cell wall biosynthesis
MTRSTIIPRSPSARSPDPVALAGLSVVLPCFNEEANVAEAIRSAAAAAGHAGHEYEVIVVDDGSSDRTMQVTAACANVDPRVRLVVHTHNRGYGAAVRSGINAAKMPWTLLTDADLQFDLSELQDFLPLTADADLIVGWRIMRRDPPVRRLNAAAWNWLVRRMFNVPVRDVDCAFKLARTELLQGVQLVSDGAMVSAELVIRCLAAGARLQELGVHHRPRIAGEQTGANPRVVARAFRELVGLRGTLEQPPTARTATAG